MEMTDWVARLRAVRERSNDRDVQAICTVMGDRCEREDKRRTECVATLRDVATRLNSEGDLARVIAALVRAFGGEDPRGAMVMVGVVDVMHEMLDEIGVHQRGHRPLLPDRVRALVDEVKRLRAQENQHAERLQWIHESHDAIPRHPEIPLDAFLPTRIAAWVRVTENLQKERSQAKIASDAFKRSAEYFQAENLTLARERDISREIAARCEQSEEGLRRRIDALTADLARVAGERDELAAGRGNASVAEGEDCAEAENRSAHEILDGARVAVGDDSLVYRVRELARSRDDYERRAIATAKHANEMAAAVIAAREALGRF